MNGPRKKLLVVSHERSGTHFLINTLAQNFGYDARQIDLDNTQRVNFRDPRAVGVWFARYHGREEPRIFKSHHSAAFLRPLLPALGNEYRVLYLLRDGRDVLTSFWRWLNALQPGWGPQTETVGEFLHAVPAGGILQYQHRACATMLERWIVHLRGWLDCREWVSFVSYETLSEDFTGTLSRLAALIGSPPTQHSRPDLAAPSSLPWKGEIGNYRTHFTAQDLADFNAAVAGRLPMGHHYARPDVD